MSKVYSPEEWADEAGVFLNKATQTKRKRTKGRRLNSKRRLNEATVNIRK